MATYCFWFIQIRARVASNTYLIHIIFAGRVIAAFIFATIMRHKEYIFFHPPNIWVLLDEFVIFKIGVKSIPVSIEEW